jgi:two-component system nitrate/nitrite response regulator NarL
VAIEREKLRVTVRALIVDVHQLFAEAIQTILNAHDLDVVGIAGSPVDAVDRARALEPDLVLIDIGAPATGGVPVGARILRECPGARVVAVTGAKNAGIVREAVAAGFHGYLTKDMPMSEFVAAVKAVLAGQVVLPHPLAIASGLLGEADHDGSASAAQLTGREREILALLAEGLTGPAIARRLSISPHTVRTHIQNLLSKLQVHTRLEAAAFAVRHGIRPVEAEAIFA